MKKKTEEVLKNFIPSEKEDKTTGFIEKEIVDYFIPRRQELIAMRSQFETEWNEDMKLYSSEESTTGDTDVSINFNTAYTYVQTAHAERMDNLPKIKFEPVEYNDVAISELQQATFDTMWHSSKSDIEYYKMDLEMGQLGTSHIHTTWELKKRTVYDPVTVDKKTGQITKWKEREIVVYDDVRNEHVDLRDCYPNIDVDNPSLDNMNEFMRKKTISWTTWETYFKDNPVYSNTDYVVEVTDTDKKENNEESKKGDTTNEKELVLWYIWNEAKDLYSIFAGDIPILITHMDVNKRLPWAVYVNHMESNSYYGRGEIRLVKKMAEFKNEIVNMMLAQTRYSIYSPMLVPESIDFTGYPDKNPTWSPGAVWPVSDPGAVQFVKTQPIGGDAYNMVSKLNEEMIYLTAINPQAVMSQPGNESAFEKSIQRNSQQIRVRCDQKINDRQGLQRTVELSWGLMQFYYTKERAQTIAGDISENGWKKVPLTNKKIIRKEGKIIKIVDSEGIYDMFEVEPDIIRHPVNVRVKSNSSLINNKELQVAKLIEATQAATPLLSLPGVAEEFPAYDILSELFKNFNIRPSLTSRKAEEKDPYKENDDMVNGIKVTIDPGEDHELHLSVHSELRPFLEEEVQNTTEMYQLMPDDKDRENAMIMAQIKLDRFEKHFQDTISAKMQEDQPVPPPNPAGMPMEQMGNSQAMPKPPMSPEMGELRTPTQAPRQQGVGSMQGQALTMNNV